MTMSCIVCEINEDMDRKLRFYALFYITVATIFVIFSSQTSQAISYNAVQNVAENSNFLSRMHQRYRRQTTDGIARSIAECT